MEHGAWKVQDGVCRIEDGAWRMEHGWVSMEKAWMKKHGHRRLHFGCIISYISVTLVLISARFPAI